MSWTGAVGFVNAHSTRGADAVAMQEQHDLADDLLLGAAGDNPGFCVFASL
jgi:hypothetical protein